MASIIMKRGTTSEISNTPISDGQILFETDTKNIYIDKGSNRIEYRATTIDIDSELNTTSENPVQNKVITTNINTTEANLGDVTSLTTTDKSSVVGAVNELNSNLKALGNFGIGTGTFPSATNSNVSVTVPGGFLPGNCCQIGLVAQNANGTWYNISGAIASSPFPGRVEYTANAGFNGKPFRVIYYKYA